MKDNLLMIFVFVILLTGFFSSAGYTGNYLFGSTYQPTYTSGKNYYVTRDYLTTTSVVGDYDAFKTMRSMQPSYTTTTLLEGDKGDLDCDGDVDYNDVTYLGQQYERRNSLSRSLNQGLYARFSSGFSTYRNKFIGSVICDLSRGDINDDGDLDFDDYQLLNYAVMRGGETEAEFVEKDCNPEGSYVNALGQICTCVKYKGSTVEIPYSFEKCKEAPFGYRAVQAGHGKTKLLPMVYNLEVS